MICVSNFDSNLLVINNYILRIGFITLITMTKGKGKKVAKVKHTGGPSSLEIARESPSEECKKFMIECIIAFYESETTLSLDNKYIRYQEECVPKFKTDMK